MADTSRPVRSTASFRDPSGFVFWYRGEPYRQVNGSYAETYRSLQDSGLFPALRDQGLLVAHEEVDGASVSAIGSYHCLLKPEKIPYISYPYEWCFSQLRDAARLSLRVQSIALEYGFSLKDASAYNVQFVNGRPVLIDTLSFEPYREGAPWVAYRQFCQHFLAPLALMAHTSVELARLLVTYIDGIPLPLASRLLPARTRLNYGLLAHVHLHAKMQQRYADAARPTSAGQNPEPRARVSRTGLLGLLQSLDKSVAKLKWKLPETEWSDYYRQTNYSDDAMRWKKQLVDQMLASIPGELEIVQDLGANNGEFSRIAARHCRLVVSQDVDPVAVELNYRQTQDRPPGNILPLRQDLSAPSPAIGWANAERDSLLQRGGCDAVLALALIHHLALGNNVPLPDIARLFARLGRWLIVEFVPKTDSQVQRLLASRADVFPDYTESGFTRAFEAYFSLQQRQPVADSERTLFLLRRLER